MIPLSNTKSTFDPASTYADLVHVVHLYVVEAHPGSGTVSAYTGKVSTSTNVAMPHDYAGRVALAKETITRHQIPSDQLLLVDDLTPRAQNNPGWCTYGPAPYAGYLIGQDGVIVASEIWASDIDFPKIIDAHLASR